jgi:glycerol-3-phosphate dehydrogenase
MNRCQLLRALELEREWDVIVVGGGATGLGVAVDAATRGLRTVLLEANDFAKGTSSRSTKLVHGGVRYLEQGDIPLVLEALRERGLLHRNAPHLVHHLSFIVPRYKWWEGPFFGIGLKVYDALAGRLNLAASKVLSREEPFPNAYRAGKPFDGDDKLPRARSRWFPGSLMPALGSPSGIVQSGCRDEKGGLSAQQDASFYQKGTGKIALRTKPARLLGAESIWSLCSFREILCGSHTSDRRAFWNSKAACSGMILPRGRTEPRSTEIGFLRNARYLARDHRRYFDVRPSTQCGHKKNGEGVSLIPKNPRFHSGLRPSSCRNGPFRQMAEDTLNHASLIGGFDLKPCATENLPLHGWRSRNAASLPKHLAAYGTDAARVEELAAEDPALAEPLHPRLTYIKASVVWAAREEMALTVEDVLSRRTRALLLDAKAAIEAAPVTARLLAKERGKDSAWAASQVEQFESLAANYLVRRDSAALKPDIRPLPATPP